MATAAKRSRRELSMRKCVVLSMVGFRSKLMASINASSWYLTKRHFGGRQWYFRCPYLNRRASVLWRPPGARDFSCRQRWGRQVAYVSQFMTSIDRAHRGKAKINSRLCSAGGFEPDEWEFPPKPKWMRWQTYARAEEEFDRYEMILNQGIADLIARLGPI